QAVAQLRSTPSPSRNLTTCLSFVRRAAAQKAAALFLPEASDFIAPDAQTSLSLAQPLSTSPFVQGLCAAAREHQLPICVGEHPPNAAAGKMYNTLLWISAGGHITHTYRKLHLFDVSLSASNTQLRESASVARGPRIEDPVDTALGKLGMLICFDVRFPEPSLVLRHRGAQVLVYPSAFTVPTGRAHWEVLLRARAIETQSYVVAAAQVGVHDSVEEGGEGKRRSYGHSMVVDPWGEVVARLGGEGEEEEEEGKGRGNDEGGMLFVEVDLGLVERVRREVRLVRRIDVYPELT
ncbi:nitrilase, partial [Westerdykella ornata]